jgi:hypothetical protein
MANSNAPGRANCTSGYFVAILCLAAGRILSRRCRRQDSGTPPALSPGGAARSLQTYLRSALTLRQIHSLKLTRAERWSQWLKFMLIGTSTVATCIGFIGISDLAADLNLSEGLVNLMMNLILLLLLIAVISELAWKFSDRASQHQRALVVLTGFIRDLENRLRQPIERDDPGLIREFGGRHALIIEILPAHTDRDYLQAKKAAAKKDAAKRKIKAEYP